jgi:hypothetical protein
MTEFSNLGTHCSFNECNRQDFLPIKCDLCELSYCREHGSYTGHKCSKYDENQKPIPEQGPIPTYTCSLNDCSKRELVQVLCEFCKLNFCMLHRLQTDHNCKALEEQKQNQQQQPQKQKQEFKFELKTNVSEKNANLANKLALMKLKQNAEGPPGLPEESRFYCFITTDSQTKKPFYLSKKWPIGRCIEFMQQKFSISSKNVHLKLNTDSEGLNRSDIVEDLVNKSVFTHGMNLYLIE